VLPDEELSSYVFRADQVIKKTNTLHHTRLTPRRSAVGRLEVSVLRSTGLTEEKIWSICQAHFDVHSPKPEIGRGVGRASVVYAENLEFDPDGKPYPEHANIVGWHEEAGKPDNELKHFWMDKAQRMASHFTYKPRP
jgi:hypothetical protein